MTKRQKYFIKQKLMGVLGLVFAVLSVQLTNGDGTMAFILTIPSLVLIFSKKMLLVNNYYMDVMDKKSKRL